MNRPRTVVSHTMQLAAAPDTVFPLFCPVREYEWIENWHCEMIHTASGTAETGCVFQTNFAQDGPLDTWVISHHEPPRIIEFVRINALRTIHYAIHLENAAAGQSCWRWTQTLTSLNKDGDSLVSTIDPTAFAQKITALEARLAHFIATGKILSGQASSFANANAR